MEQARAGEYDAFVAARWSVLFHLARLLTGGDRHRAEDLLQESLVKLWFVWPKIADEAPEAYVRKVLARAAARSARRRWWGERPVEELPEVAAAGDMLAVLLVPLLLRLRPPLVLVVHTAVTLVLVLGSQQIFANVSRYLLPCFPLFVPLAVAMRRLGLRTQCAVLGVAALASGSYAGYALFELGVP